MIIKILVKTGRKEPKVVSATNDELIVYTKGRPINNEANDEIISLLANHYKTAKSSITIKSGFRSKQKMIEIFL